MVFNPFRIRGTRHVVKVNLINCTSKLDNLILNHWWNPRIRWACSTKKKNWETLKIINVVIIQKLEYDWTNSDWRHPLQKVSIIFIQIFARGKHHRCKSLATDKNYSFPSLSYAIFKYYVTLFWHLPDYPPLCDILYYKNNCFNAL